MNKKFILVGFLALLLTLGAGCQWPSTTDDTTSEPVAGPEQPEVIIDTCTSESGSTMNLDEAKTIAQASECGEQGILLESSSCNEGTATWWIDLSANEPKEGCNPACVVNLETKEAEINWRCTGLIVPEE